MSSSILASATDTTVTTSRHGARHIRRRWFNEGSCCSKAPGACTHSSKQAQPLRFTRYLFRRNLSCLLDLICCPALADCSVPVRGVNRSRAYFLRYVSVPSTTLSLCPFSSLHPTSRNVLRTDSRAELSFSATTDSITPSLLPQQSRFYCSFCITSMKADTHLIVSVHRCVSWSRFLLPRESS